MTTKPRNHKAEYQARQARSRAKYGVSYNIQRALISKAKERDATPTQVRRALTTAKAAKDNPSSMLHGLPATIVGPAIAPNAHSDPPVGGGDHPDLAHDIKVALELGTMAWGDVLDFVDTYIGYEHETFYCG